MAEACAGIAAALARRGIGPGATLLDAGCGAGRYAAELARRGYVVTGMDRSPDLLAEARRRPVDAGARVRFESGDLLALPGAAGFDAIVCRGVLNDLVEPAERAAVFGVFARALRPERRAAARRARLGRERGREDGAAGVGAARGHVARAAVFRSVTRLDPATRRLLIAECHTLTTGSGEVTARHDFVMGCWSRDELEALLRAAGFEAMEYAGTYEGAPLGVGDRIVVAASRGAR